MSVLVLNVIPEGIIMGTDRLVRFGPDPNGQIGVTEGFKILRWPNRRAIMGFVGMGDLGRQANRNSTYEWLSDFIGTHHDFESLSVLAQNLCDAIQQQYETDGWTGQNDEVLVVELAGFHTNAAGIAVPQVWHIANTHGIVDGTYGNIDGHFGVSEECRSKYPQLQPVQLRQRMGVRPHWIHQTGEFQLFNNLCRALDAFFRLRLLQFGINPAAEPPGYDRLVDFESRVRMKILSYGAYNDAFETPTARSVGLGADVLFLEWPE